MWYFFFEFVYIVDYFEGFPYIEPSLHPWDEACLIIMNDHFGVFLDLVCKNFIEYFCFNVSHLVCVTAKTLKFMFFSIFKNLKLKVATVVPNPSLWEMHQENSIFEGRIGKT